MYQNSKIPWRFQVQKKQLVSPQVKARIKFLINDRYLKPGDMMPAGRELAAELGICKRLVEDAYRDLKATRWLEKGPGNRTYVSKIRKVNYVGEPPPAVYKFAEPPSFYPGLEAEPFLKIGSNSATKVVEYSRILTQRKMQALIRNSESGGAGRTLNDCVMEILSDRNIIIHESQLCIVDGKGRNLNVVALSLLNYQDKVVMTSPHDKAVGACHLKNATAYFTGADDDGMRVDKLEEICRNNKIAAVFLRPAEDYPRCGTLSIDKRKRILDLAEKYDFVIIEMYKEQDFLSVSEPPSFWELGAHHRVIYISSISRMYGDLNAKGIVLAAPDFIEKLNMAVGRFGDTETWSNHMVIKMVEGDYFRLYSDKMYEAHRELRHEMGMIMRNFFNDGQFTISRSGWAAWATLNQPVDPTPFIPKLLELGVCKAVDLPRKARPVKSLLVGFGGNSSGVIGDALKYLLGHKVLGNLILVDAGMMPFALAEF